MSSNNLTQVRDYINSRIRISEPSFNEWLGSLDDIGNIPSTVIDNSYIIELGSTTSTEQIDQHIQEDQTVIITIFKRGFNSPTEARDSLMQTANCIRLDIIKPLNVDAYKQANDGNIDKVVSVGLTPSEIDATNDNTIKVDIELSVALLIKSS